MWRRTRDFVVAPINPPTDEGERTHPEDGRAEWTRPALHRLKVSSAEAKGQKGDDGVKGMGIS
jgi:hypothetical protein